MNVLLVTYSFPPAGGVGVLRAASLARYLPSIDVRLDVLTARSPSAVGADPGLLDDIPSDVTIHRTLTLDLPFSLKKWLKGRIAGTRKLAASSPAAGQTSKPGLLRRIVQDLLLPDPQITWLPILTRNAIRIITERKIDLVLITVPPFSTSLLVRTLRRRFPHLAIVLDFRDEWLATSIDLISFSSSPRARRIAHQAEAEAVASSTAVVAVTEPARKLLQSRYPGQSAAKFHVVPNGYDATRLPQPAHASAPSADRPVLLTYLGTVYGTTEPTALVEAIRTVSADLRARLRLRFIGRIEDPNFRAALLDLGETVELLPFLPQAEALQALGESDYALLITHDPVNVSAKFYDYLGVGKPILATVHPDGAVRHLLEELRAGWWADSRDVPSIRKLLGDAVVKRDLLSHNFHPEVAKIQRYERKALASKYAQLLNRIHEGKQLTHSSDGLTPSVVSGTKV
ncbi:MAG TPA: glycosyltransferase [Terracidiphilus sp.]|nr:glycosyltransferase [Terracidiphilus sp.]